MRSFTGNDVNPMSWNEYGEVIDKLYKKIFQYMKKNNIEFDAIAPIMRSGGISGNILAIKLNVKSIIPLQLKYERDPSRIEVLQSPAGFSQKAGDKFRNILICETNTVKGLIAKDAVVIMKRYFPDSKFYYATVAKVFGGPDHLENCEEYFFGILTDEKFAATEDQMKEYHIRPKITIFPWENIEDELKEIF